MPSDSLCRTVHQYSKGTIPVENMRILQEIADDYCKVKNYVYRRYGGKGGLSKIYPGYTVQNEMTNSGLREQLNMPSVYFYLAVFDALGDIKNQWTQAKSRTQRAITENEGLTPEERHYLRFILKSNNIMDAVLNDKNAELPEDMQRIYEDLSAEIEPHRLNNYLKRKVRKYLCCPHAETPTGFSVSERACRYANHGIYLTTKEKRKRIFIPLTDSNKYERQFYIKLDHENRTVELLVPVNMKVRRHPDYENVVGVSFGLDIMFTTESGHAYGERLGAYVKEETGWVDKQNATYMQNRQANCGRKKYREQKRRRDEKISGYINAEINRFLREEKPGIIYIPKFPPHNRGGVNREYNRTVAMWRKGYIRQRLKQKCRQQDIEVIEVFAGNISSQCSVCGKDGMKRDSLFICPFCKMQLNIKENAARNIMQRGRAQKENHKGNPPYK